MKFKILFSTMVILLASCLCYGQDDEDASGFKYKLLATKKTSTMQKELDQVSSQGYRIVASSTTSGSEMAVFLSRDSTHENPYKYKLLATTRTSTMQKELNELADQGYRLLPSTLIQKKKLFGGIEIVMILELSPDSGRKFEYKLLATKRTSTLQKETTEAAAAGFHIVGMVSRGEHMVVVEREVKDDL